MKKPAILGGEPAFKQPLHVGRPNLPDRKVFDKYVDRIFDSRWLTNNGPLVSEFQEKLEEFLNVVRNTPQARMIAEPTLLTNDGQAGSIEIRDDVENSESTKLSIKNTVQPDKKTVTLELDFEYACTGVDGQGTSSIATKVTLLSGHAIAITGMVPNNDKMVLLVKPQVLDSGFGATEETNGVGQRTAL